MTVNINWIDIVIAVILFVAMIKGISAGLIRSLFSITGLFAGLMAAKTYYVRLGNHLPIRDWLPTVAADTFSFLAIFIVSAAAIYYIGSFISGSLLSRSMKKADRFLGSFIGLLAGTILVGALIIIFTAFPLSDSFPGQVGESFLAEPIADNVYIAYDTITGILNAELPKLTIYPEDLGTYFSTVSTDADLNRVDFKTLDSATCFVCGGEVDYLGILENGKSSVSPKFVCTFCGRTSDGCQTYEGYHIMYGQCPVALGNQGYRLDCGIWANNSYHRPTGPCPVCGTE